MKRFQFVFFVLIISILRYHDLSAQCNTPVASQTSGHCAGNSPATLTVATSGTISMVVWFDVATNQALSNGTTYSGQGTQTLTISNPFSLNGNQYKALVYGSCGAQYSNIVTLRVNSPLTFTVSNSLPVCLTYPFRLNGPDGMSSYSWTGPNSFTSTSQSPTIIAIPMSAGTYTLTATNSSGCSGSASTTVTVNTPPTVTTSSNSPVCQGSTLNLSGPSGMSGYSWTGPNGFTSTSQNPTVSTNVSTSMTGSYSLTVTNSAGCTISGSTTVTVNTLPTVTIGNNSPVCEGGTLNLSGPSGMSGYSWTGPNNFTSTSQNPTVSTRVTTGMGGTYILTVTNSNGCVGSASTNVTVNSSPVFTVSNSLPICLTYPFRLNGPGGMSSYSWTGPNSFTSTSQSPTIIAIPMSAGTYTLTATNSSGCSGSASTTVTVNTPPTVTTSSNSPVCQGSTLNLSGPSGMSSYSWTGPNNFTSTSQNPTVSTNVSTSMAGSYSLTVTSSAGCTNSGGTTVTLNTPPTVTVSNNSPVCPGSTLNLSGPGGMSGYSWTGPNNFTSTSQNPTVSTNVSASMAGNYSLTVTNSSGCTNSGSTTVTVNTNPTATIIPASSATCAGIGLGLMATPSGGSGIYVIHAWSGAGASSLSSAIIDSPIFMNTTPGTYALTYNVVDNNGCQGSASTMVTVNPNPTASIIPASPSASAGIRLSLTAIPSGGSGTYTAHTWTGSGATSLSSTNVTTPTFINGNVGTYDLTYTVTDTKECKGLVSTTVAVNAPMNYIISHTILKDSVTDEVSVPTIPIEGIQESIDYFDGLGRPIQTVITMGSPSKKDIVQPMDYDQFGREAQKYLPYTDGNDGSFKANALADPNTTATTDLDKYRSGKQYAFYQLQGQASDQYPYSQTVFEASPLNRIFQQGAPGRDWQPGKRPVQTSYTSNVPGSAIRYWVIKASGASLGNPSHYDDNTLYCTITYQSEPTNSFQTREYKDKEGKVILKQNLSDPSCYTYTYYIYDDFGRLSFVLPPAFPSNCYGFNEQDSLFKQYVYAYKYDSRSRMIAKHLPGAGWVFMIYDLRDRLVMSQDSNQRVASKWLFTKYDAFNRPVLTGIKVFTDSRQTIQDKFTTYTGTMYESMSGNDYTLINSYPSDYAVLATDLLTKTYYDNYSFTNKYDFDAASKIATYTDNDGVNNGYLDLVKGQVTGSASMVLDGSNSKWLYTTTYYDDKYRAIQTLRNLYDGASGGLETVNNKYDFVGKTLQTRQTQVFNSTTTTVDNYFTYDHAGRLIKTEHQVNGDATNGKVETSSLVYNEIGQLADKKLHKTTLGTYLQSEDYKYNIRGWLTQINNPDNLTNDGTSDTNADLFAMRLNYNTSEIGLMDDATKIKYNGNVTSMVWNASGKGKQGYGYTYDGLDRLLGSDYKTNNGTLWKDSMAFEEKSIAYDLNGNMTQLLRTTNTGTNLNNFSYVYSGNQLKTLVNKDNSANFVYAYDGNGNMTTDGLRGMNLTYNLLNLPATIAKGTDNLSYIYSANGEKLAKLKNGTAQQYYCGSMEYNNTKALDYILHSEGMVKNSSGSFTYEYYLKDHLGNTRVVFSPGSNGTPVIGQVDEYYPFGLSYRPISPDNGNKYLYNGKEIQDETLGGTFLGLYDVKWRFYDPAIGRFTSLDRLAEKYPYKTPYDYAENNPSTGFDLDGLEFVNPNMESDLNAAYKINPEGYKQEAVFGAVVVVDIIVTKGWLGKLTGVYALGNMLDYTSKAERTDNPTQKQEYQQEAGQSATVALVGAIIEGVVPLLSGPKKLPAPKVEVSTVEKPAVTTGNLPKPAKGNGSVPPSQRDPKRLFTKSEKAEMLKNQNGTCAQCSESKTVDEVDGHHVERHADGGKTTTDNGAAVCKDCHKELHK